MAQVDSPLLRQQLLQLTNGDQKAADQMVATFSNGNIQDIYDLGDQLGIPGEKLLGLRNGVALKPEDIPISDNNYLQQQKQISADSGLTKRIDDIYNQQYETGKANIDQDFGQQRQKAIEEEAALGRLRSPASIPVISNVDNSRSKALSQFAGQLGAQRAGQEFGLSQYLDQAARNSLQQKKQNLFNQQESTRNLQAGRQGLDFQKQGLGQQLMLGITGLNNSRILGEKSLEPQNPNTLDYINAFTGAARAGANIWSASKGAGGSSSGGGSGGTH